MVTAAEIRGEESLRTWIRGCTPGDAHQLAVRAALRVAPFLFLHNTLPATVTLRLLLTLCLAAQRRTEAPDERLTAAYRAFRGNGAPMDANGSPILRYPGEQIVFRCISAAVEARENVTRSAEAASHVMVLTNEGAIPDFQIASLVADMALDAASIESGGNPFGLPLWRDDSAAVWVSDAVERLGARGPSWVFWADWYEGYLTGKPLDIDLLEQVALIPSEDWDKGDDHVNGIISEIYDAWRLNGLLEKTPNAERIAVNADTGRFYADPVSDVPADHLADARDKMVEANAIFEGAEGGNDPYGMLKPERNIIHRALSTYGERPMMLHDACRRASRRVQGKVARGDCPERDPLIEDYVRQLDEVAGDLLAFDPKVKEVVVARVQGAIEAASPEQRQLLVDAAEAGAAVSEGVLAEELPADALIATDPAEPLESRKEATYRYTSRIARMYSLGRKGLSEVSGVTKDVAVVGGGLYALWKAIPYLLTLL